MCNKYNDLISAARQAEGLPSKYIYAILRELGLGRAELLNRKSKVAVDVSYCIWLNSGMAN